MLKRLPILNTKDHFVEARQRIRDYGYDSLRKEHVLAGIADEQHNLTTGFKPFNIFARLAGGVMAQKGMEEANGYLGDDGEHFMVACNLPKNDEMWEDGTKEWLGKASMAKNHRFMLIRSLEWRWFNALVYGMSDDEDLDEAIELLEHMKRAALAFTRADKTTTWSEDPKKIGLYFHCYPHCSVNHTHLHIVDLSMAGPTHEHLRFKNLKLDDVIAVLKEEKAQRA